MFYVERSPGGEGGVLEASGIIRMGRTGFFVMGLVVTEGGWEGGNGNV